MKMDRSARKGLSFTPCFSKVTDGQEGIRKKTVETVSVSPRPLPTLLKQGVIESGPCAESLVDVDFTSVQDSISFWTSFDHCDSIPQTKSFDDIQQDIWNGCLKNSSVELYTIVNGGHAWPGGGSGWPGSDKPTQSISASQIIWEFFVSHPKP